MSSPTSPLRARIKKDAAKPSGLKGKLLETYANSVRICGWCQGHAWNLMKKGGRYAWVLAAISIVTIVPLIFEVEREVQVLELEELQIQKLTAEGVPREQIQQMGLVGTSGSVADVSVGLKDQMGKK